MISSCGNGTKAYLYSHMSFANTELMPVGKAITFGAVNAIIAVSKPL